MHAAEPRPTLGPPPVIYTPNVKAEARFDPDDRSGRTYEAFWQSQGGHPAPQYSPPGPAYASSPPGYGSPGPHMYTSYGTSPGRPPPSSPLAYQYSPPQPHTPQFQQGPMTPQRSVVHAKGGLFTEDGLPALGTFSNKIPPTMSLSAAKKSMSPRAHDSPGRGRKKKNKYESPDKGPKSKSEVEAVESLMFLSSPVARSWAEAP
ncbi:uncharacterized protein V1510DRAFT_416293 [Dipodascopsis tothii]|uniref:uncharacterized protein n=1 Tax=Dipodascopsis tothii TaxID=44089 RepID=UPI0034CD80F3